MHKANDYRASLVFAAGLAGAALLSSGCVVREHVYETDHPRDHWDSREQAAYQRYREDQRLDEREYQRLNAEEQQRYHGWKDFRIWWLLFVGIVLAIYAFFLWRRIQHPW